MTCPPDVDMDLFYDCPSDLEDVNDPDYDFHWDHHNLKDDDYSEEEYEEYDVDDYDPLFDTPSRETHKPEMPPGSLTKRALHK